MEGWIVNVPDLGSDVIGVAIRSAIVYLFLVLALRLGGKREVGQLTIPDLVVLLLIANGVQNAMVGSNSTLIGGLVSGIVVIGLARLVELVSDRSRLVSKLVVGEPRELARDGKPDVNALREEDITDVELAAALRQHGIESLDQTKLVMLEVDGSISVIPVDPGMATSGGGHARRAGRIASHGYGRRGNPRSVSPDRGFRADGGGGTRGSD